MNNNFFYSKKAMAIIRLAACFALILLFFANINILQATHFFTKIDNNHRIFSFIENCCFIPLTLLLIIKPQNFILIGIISLWYSVGISFSEPENMMCIPMFFLTVGTFLVRGFFLKHKKKKIVMFICIFIYELLIPLHFGIPTFFNSAISKIGFSFVFILSYFFVSQFQISKAILDTKTMKVLNLAQFEGIYMCDVDLLEKVLQNKKYNEITLELHGNPGTVRNRLNKLYDILQVGDRTGFIAQFYGYKIIFEQPCVPTEQ